ncbi:MAG: 4Fe-4S dicluster domain-containing protein [Planctomycetota bacterium]|jgi:ferredoxin
METVFTSNIKNFLDAVAQDMELYVPKQTGNHYVFTTYNTGQSPEVKFNEIRTCEPVKEFLFPVRESAAVYPNPAESQQVKPFAVFGLKECDLRSIEILDKVFVEDDFVDPLYTSKRDKMFIIASDCTEPGETCFCNIFGLTGNAQTGFDLNVARIKDGFIIESGSVKGKDFLSKHSSLFADTPTAAIEEREENRKKTKDQLEQNNADLKFDSSVKEIIEDIEDSEVFDKTAETCIECQACTRVCPTCHCFYLYDTSKSDYFTKMKMWDSCMRTAYAAVAGGENPRKVLGDRMHHRMLHKFVYFLERYGLDMCVGCGRCVDADAGGMDIRNLFKQLDEKRKTKT